MSFHELATTAAIGVGQRPFRADDLPPALLPLIDSDAEPALQLLDAAAGWEAVRRTEVPSGAEPQEVAEAPESRPEPSPSLTSLLRRIIELPDGDDVLLETCSALHAAGLRLPHRLLMPVLNRLRKDDAALATARPALGARGEWLLQALPRLTRRQPVEPRATDWDDGTAPQRTEWLRRLNRTDPAAAVALLEASWKSEPLENRVAFLGIFEEAPHPAQVDFLEAALLDRSEKVAVVARAGLAKLPASPWRTRMLGYAAALRVDGSDLVLTETPGGKQATRDGATGAGALRAIASAVPPAEWPRLVGLSAPALLECCGAEGATLARATVVALGRSSIAFRDVPLAALVLAQLETIPEAALADDLVAVLDVPTRLLVAQRSGNPRIGLAALKSLPAPWPQQVVDVALTRLDQWRIGKRLEAEAAFKLIEQAVSPWLAAAAIRRINPEPRYPTEPTRRASRLITVLTLRAAVAEEIRPYLNQENR